MDRSAWGAVGALGALMPLPAREVYIHHSVTAATDYDDELEPTDDPAGDMRTIERVGIERFGRMSYSWAFHPSGIELEGAGRTIGAHTGGRNSRSFGLVLIGNYETYRPTSPQIHAVARRIRKLIASGHLLPSAPIMPHRSVKATACPGRYMLESMEHLRTIVASPESEPLVPNPYQYVATVTLDRDVTTDGKTIPAGVHVFHVAGSIATHVGPDGRDWLANKMKMTRVRITEGAAFLDAHAVQWGMV